MSSGNNAIITGSMLRERDQKILNKHEKEKADLEIRIQKLRQFGDDRAKELFDVLHRGDRLARSIGFDNLYKAQIFLDSLDRSITFKESLDRIKILEAELNCEKKEVEILQARLDKVVDSSKLQSELEKLKTESSNSERHHQEQLRQLQERYDTLKVVKARAAERYKSDFKKWREFSKWLFAENDEHHKFRNEPGISHEEKKRRDTASVMRKRRNMIEIGPNLARFEGEPDDPQTEFSNPPPIGRTEPESDKENETIAPLSPQSKPPAVLEHHFVSPSRPLQDIRLNQAANTKVDTPSQPFALHIKAGPTRNSHTPLSESCDRKHGDSPIRVVSRGLKRGCMTNSSDTEDDSQAVAVPSTNPRSGKHVVFKVPAPPTPNQLSAQEGVGASNDMKSPPDPEPPTKIRRLSDQADPLSSPQQDDQATPCPPRLRKKQQTSATPRGDQTPLRPEDYSAFKGRGRYSRQIQNSDKTINALYEINPANNDGKAYQYQDVVRNKDERRKMHGGDCECCREYYKNVGPLPNRLQPPLWRSPSKIRVLDESFQGNSESSDHQADIHAHQKAISRHRQTWARAETPPGYWEIGFPSTQEVSEINRKAKEIQKKKMVGIDKESNKDAGRYRKR